MFLILLLLLLSLSGCSATNISELVNALAKDQNAYCATVTSPYAGVTLGRGSEKASVSITGGNCTITGSGVTPVQVPVKVNVTPAQ